MRRFNFLWIGEQYSYMTPDTFISVEVTLLSYDKGTVKLLTPTKTVIECSTADIEPIGEPLAPLRELVKMFDYEKDV